jgi:hypothetical protein
METEKEQSKKTDTIKILTVLVAIELIVSIMLAYTIYGLSDDLGKLRVEVLAQQAQIESTRGGLYAEIDYQKSLQKPVVSPKEMLVIIPELGISLPYNETTKSLQYSYNDLEGSIDTRVTSTLITDHESRQMGCSELVRISTESGTPYSPWEKSAGEVKLEDGRTIYIIEAIAFANDEASTEECASEAWINITPEQITEQFKEAKVY